VFCCAAVNTVQAQWARVSYAEVCFSGTGIDLLDIEFCGHAIRAGDDLSDISLATLHTQRGSAYTAQGDFLLAIADFDTALRLNSFSAVAFNSRGVAYHAQGDFVHALADFRRAIELSPNYAEAHRNRGTSYYFRGDAVRAASDYNTAVALNPWDPELVAFRGLAYYQRGLFAQAALDFARAQSMEFPYQYLALWRYLAEEQAGVNARAVLTDAYSQLDEGEWPRSLLAVYLNDKGPEAARAAVRDSPADIRAARLSEVNFYLGELSRVRGDDKRAADLLRAAVAAGFEDSIEHLMARAALQRMTN